MFVWSKVQAEKTEEDALGIEVATTFDGFSRRFVFSCYVNFNFHKTETTDAHLLVHSDVFYLCFVQYMSVPQMSVEKCLQMQNLLRSLPLYFFHFTFLIKHQLILNIFTLLFVNCELATRADLL